LPVEAWLTLRRSCDSIVSLPRAAEVLWGCVAIVVAAVAISLAVGGAGYLFFLGPYMLMMGAMMGGSGRGSSNGKQK